MDELEKLKDSIFQRIKSGDLSPWQAVQVIAAKRSEIQANRIEGGSWTPDRIEDGNWMDEEIEIIEKYLNGNWMDEDVEESQKNNPPGNRIANPARRESPSPVRDRVQSGSKGANLSPENLEIAYELKEYKDELDYLIESGQIEQKQARNIYRARLKEVFEQPSIKGRDWEGAKEIIDFINNFQPTGTPYDRLEQEVGRIVWKPTSLMPSSFFFEPTTQTRNIKGLTQMGDLSPDPTSLGVSGSSSRKSNKTSGNSGNQSRNTGARRGSRRSSSSSGSSSSSSSSSSSNNSKNKTRRTVGNKTRQVKEAPQKPQLSNNPGKGFGKPAESKPKNQRNKPSQKVQSNKQSWEGSQSASNSGNSQGQKGSSNLGSNSRARESKGSGSGPQTETELKEKISRDRRRIESQNKREVSEKLNQFKKGTKNPHQIAEERRRLEKQAKEKTIRDANANKQRLEKDFYSEQQSKSKKNQTPRIDNSKVTNSVDNEKARIKAEEAKKAKRNFDKWLAEQAEQGKKVKGKDKNAARKEFKREGEQKAERRWEQASEQAAKSQSAQKQAEVKRQIEARRARETKEQEARDAVRENKRIKKEFNERFRKSISQPPNKLPQPRAMPSNSKRRGLGVGNAGGQIVGDINSTFAADYHERIGLRAIELAGGLDKWNKLTPEQQRQLRLEARDQVTPYLDTLRDAWRQGKPAFDRLWNKIKGERQNPMMPKGGLGGGLKPFQKGLEGIAPTKPHPFENWDGSPWRGMTPDEIERDVVDRFEPWRKPGYYPGKEDGQPPNYDPRDPAWKPLGVLPGDAPIPSPIPSPQTRANSSYVVEFRSRRKRKNGEGYDFQSRPGASMVVPGQVGGLSRETIATPGGVTIVQIGPLAGIGTNLAGLPKIHPIVSPPSSEVDLWEVEIIKISPLYPEYPIPAITIPSPAIFPAPTPEPKPPPTPAPKPSPPPEPLPQPKPKPKTIPKPKTTPKPNPAPKPLPKPLPDPRPKPDPVPDPKPEPYPDPESEPEAPPAPLPKPKPKPKPKPDPTKPPPRPAIPKKPNRTTITIETPIPDPNDPPIPDDEDPDMPCRYMQDLEQAVSLNRYDPLTKTMQPSTYMVHQGMAEALQFLANEIADLKRSNHQINNVTEAQTLDTTGKVMVPQVQAEVVGTMMFAGAGVTTPVKTMSEQMQAWAALNHMLSGHHQLGKTEFPTDIMNPTGAKVKPTTALGFNHWAFNQLANLIGLPTKQVVTGANGTTTAQSFKNQSDAIENIHAQNLGMEQDLSAIEKYLFKIMQALEIITNIVFQNKHDIDVIIDELGPKTKQKIVKKPSPFTHGKDAKGESFFDRLMSMADNFTVVREWNDEIDAKQLAQKTNMEAQIAALTNKWEFDKTNPKLPIVDRPKNQSPKQQNDDEWRRYVNTSENPDQMRQAPGLPIPEIKEIKLGTTKEVPKPETNPEKLLGS